LSKQEMLAQLSAVGFDVAKAIWKKGEKVPYLCLARTFSEIEKVSARTDIIRILTSMFGSIIALSPNDLLAAVYLTINKIAPSYEGLELGIGESILIKSVAHTTGKKDSTIKAEYEKLGDLGLVAVAARNTQKTIFPPPPLTIANVFNTLNQIAKATGRAVCNWIFFAVSLALFFSACRSDPPLHSHKTEKRGLSNNSWCLREKMRHNGSFGHLKGNCVLVLQKRLFR